MKLQLGEIGCIELVKYCILWYWNPISLGYRPLREPASKLINRLLDYANFYPGSSAFDSLNMPARFS